MKSKQLMFIASILIQMNVVSLRRGGDIRIGQICCGDEHQEISILSTMFFWPCEFQGKGTDATKKSSIKYIVLWYHSSDQAVGFRNNKISLKMF